MSKSNQLLKKRLYSMLTENKIDNYFITIILFLILIFTPVFIIKNIHMLSEKISVTLNIKNIHKNELDNYKIILLTKNASILLDNKNSTSIPSPPKNALKWDTNARLIKGIQLISETPNLSNIINLEITIGKKIFMFDQKSLNSKWLNKSTQNNRVVLEAPNYVSLARSKIPPLNFVMNWGGDHLILTKLIKIYFIILSIFFIFYLTTSFIAKNNKFDSLIFIKKFYRKFLFLVLILFLLFNIFYTAGAISSSISTGVITKIDALPHYGYMRIPNSYITNSANGKFSADFSCLYFTSKHFSENTTMYNNDYDPFNRPAVTFPPFINFLYHFGFKTIDFPSAALMNVFIQIIFFVIFSFFILYFYSKKDKFFLLKIMPIIVLLSFIFLSPIGLTWFERGQTDLYTGISYLLVTAGLISNYIPFIILAGIFAALKWSSLPFLFIIAVTFLFCNKMRLKRKFLLTMLPFLIIFISFIIFPKYIFDYINLIKVAELSNNAIAGVSASRIFPLYLSKLFPFLYAFIYIFLFYLKSKKVPDKELLFNNSFLPMLIGASIIATTFGTIAYEYRAISFLAFYPLLINYNYKIKGNTLLNKIIINNLYFIFLLVSFRFVNIWPLALQTFIYFIFALLFLITAFIPQKKNPLRTTLNQD